MNEVRTLAGEFEAQAPMSYPPESGQAMGTLPISTSTSSK